jgi:diguanylate cyclase (GGDEF)-like protein
MTATATSKWISVLLAAAIVGLAGAVVGMFVARAHLIEAIDWVSHTCEVQLSIAACSINLRKAQATSEGRSASQAAARVDAEHIGALKSTDNLVYKTRQRQNPDDPGAWISAMARPVRDSGGVVVAGVVALRNITTQKHQQDQLRAASMSDEMTGLHNRRGFLMLAEQHARMALRQGQPFGIAFADLNGLKAVNDLQGHEAGDRTIRAVATVLRATFRDSDIVARLGGDEFVVLLANADPGMRGAIHARLDDGWERTIEARRPRTPSLSASGSPSSTRVNRYRSPT